MAQAKKASVFFFSSIFAMIAILAACTLRQGESRAPLSSPQPIGAVPGDQPATSEIPEKREYPVNSLAKPCDGFYQYACAVPISRFKLREDRSRHILSINDSAERILKAKTTKLSAMTTATDLTPRAKQLRDSFLACMDEPARQAEEKALVQSTLKETEGMKSRPTWLAFLGRHIVEAETSFVGASIEADLRNPEKYDLSVVSSVMTLPAKEYYEEDAVTADLQALAQAFFEAVGVSDPAARAKAVVAFEKAFAASFPTQAEMRDRGSDTKYYVDRADLLNAYPALALEILLEKVPEGVGIRNYLPESSAELNKLLNETALEDLRSVYLFHALSNKLVDGYPEFFQKRLAFQNKHLGGPPALPPRDERCTSQVMSTFEKELDAELIGALFPDFPRDRFETLVNKVREAIIRRIRANTWLTAAGKEGVLKKMDLARMQLASPTSDAEWDFVAVAEYDPKAPLANQKKRGQLELDKSFANLGQPRDWRRWEMGPLTVNAYYSPPDNKFVMLQGILQYPFFDKTMTDAQTLGAVGMVVGHELGHGFDDNGFKYNPNGKLEDWVPAEDVAQFKQRTALLVDQFNAIVDPKINPNYGKLTLGENIADASGLGFAYEAAFPNNVGSIDDKQAFYLQFARVWCGVMRPKEFEKRLRTDPHAQTQSRVDEPLKHQAGFYEAYGCKAGDKMYLPPEKRMVLW